MVPLSVPEEDRRIVLRSFWFLISLIFAVLVSIFDWLIGIPPWLVGLVGSLVFVAAGSLAFSKEHLVRRLYHAWNNRITRPLGNAATGAILRVCLFLIFTATGRAGGRLQLRGTAGSMWLGRDSGKNHTSIVPFAEPSTGPLPRGWIRNYLRWAVQSHNFWAIFLIPFLCMLRMVSIEEPATSGANIYTLF